MRTTHSDSQNAFMDIDSDLLTSMLSMPEDEPEELLSAGTKSKRKRYMEIWNHTWEMAKMDPKQIWLDLCQLGPKQERAIHLCQKFLEIYATRRKRRQICLGPEEYEVVQIVNSADTINTAWHALVGAFDSTLLAEKRKEDWPNAAQWTLKIRNGIQWSSKTGPACQVSQWIRASANRLGLTREQTFVKKEATAADIILLIRTLWEKAEHIPCTADVRIAFHAVLILSGIGGFRPGIFNKIRYSEVDLELVLDPGSGERRLVAHFTLHQNKQKVGSIKKDQSNILKIPVVLGKKTILCPVSLVVARALADDAFDVQIDSLSTLLSRPTLEQGRRLKIKWKSSVLDTPIFPIDYKQFNGLWRRTTLVAGFPERVRPYSIRVGAGSRLDGVLSPALRNYLLSHTSKMFEQSYQTRQIRENLMPILDADAEAETELFEALRELSLDCDDRAPIYVTQNDINDWVSTRKDLAECRQRNKGKDHSRIIDRLCQLLLDKRRQEFFDKVADLKARGESTSALAVPQQNPARRSPYANLHSASKDVASLFKLTDDGSINQYIDKLVSIQRIRCGSFSQTWKLSLLAGDTPNNEDAPASVTNTCEGTRTKDTGIDACDVVQGGSAIPTTDLPPTKHARVRPSQHKQDVVKNSSAVPTTDLPPTEHLRSFQHKQDMVLSKITKNPGKLTASDRKAQRKTKNTEIRGSEANSKESTTLPKVDPAPLECLLCPKLWTFGTPLSQHYRRVHADDFRRPFPCPACSEDDSLINGWNEWALHIASRHGRHNAPRLRAKSQSSQDLLSCLLCYQEFATLGGLSKHTSKSHGSHFDKEKPCPVCSTKDEAPMISSLSEWCSHVELSHGGAQCAPRVLLGSTVCCLYCNKDIVHERNHYIKFHLKEFDKSFPCPECTRQGVEAPCSINGCEEWEVHCAAVHGKTTRIFGQSQRARCLVCNESYNKVADHFTKHHQQLFPFQCQECERLEGKSHNPNVLIQDRDEWVSHCATAHGNIACALSSQTVAANLRTKRKREDDLKWAKKAKQELSPGAIGPDSAETSVCAVMPGMPVDSAFDCMTVEFPSVHSEDERMDKDIGSPSQSTDKSYGNI